MASLGATPELVIGIAAGAAASAALEPALEIPKQDAWANAQNRILDPGLLARLVAAGGVDLGTAQYFAGRNGYDADQFGALVYLAQEVPGLAQALDLWRRGLIPDSLFTHALVHAGLDQRYIDQYMKYQANELLSPQDLAYMVVRAVVPDEGMLPSSLPTKADKLDLPPQLAIDPVAEAARAGWSKDRLTALVERSGLAMAPVMAAQANFRGILTDNDYALTIARGDLYPAYADPVKEASREILTAEQWMEGVLRGWWDMQTGLDGAGLHGMTNDNASRIYQIRRRPMTVANITKALARGGTFDAANAPFADPYVASVHEADLGPEWYGLAEALKYSYPSAFVVRALLTDGTLTEAEGEDIFLKSGWEPALAHKVAVHYAGGTGSGADKHVTSAQSQLWTTTHTAYKNAEIDQAEAATNLAALGISAADQTAIFRLWDLERDTFRKQLTPTQLKKAWKGAVANPATGAAWTKDEALAALIARGYSPNDANTFLEL